MVSSNIKKIKLLSERLNSEFLQVFIRPMSTYMNGYREIKHTEGMTSLDRWQYYAMLKQAKITNVNVEETIPYYVNTFHPDIKKSSSRSNLRTRLYSVIQMNQVVKKTHKHNTQVWDDFITEIEAKNKLQKFRKLNKNYLYPSFDTIAGTGSNGAIVHYRVSQKSNKVINKNDLFLCDSGGQYKFGTTDVTRTICFSKQKKTIKDVFTKVLKGHIAVYQTNLKKDNTGKKIDSRARKFLKKDGLDYAHGTGHGVGFFLNVHEGPQSISKFNSIKLKEGMIISNEPGYYKKGQYGIRIENLVFIKKNKNTLYFENLTLAPIEKDLINYDLLNKKEKDYLFRYHLKVYETYSKFLNLNQ